MIYTYKNFAEGKLAAEMSAVATSFTVTSAHSLPTTGTFIAVIWDAELYADPGKDPDVEICLATWSSGYTFNVTRAQESTSAKVHVAGCTVGNYLTAAAFNDLIGPQGPQGDAGVLRTQEYTSGSGSWTCPAGVTRIFVTIVGGGGGGGGGHGDTRGGGGGSSGRAVFNAPLTVTPGNSYSYAIGAGGAGGAVDANGSNGSSTTFDTLTATGGGGGQGNATAGGGVAPAGIGVSANGCNQSGGVGGTGGGILGVAGGTHHADGGMAAGGGGGSIGETGGAGGSGYILIMY